MSLIIQNFVSIQGEGITIGKPSLFIRFGGCNLTCSFCDTKYANKVIGSVNKFNIDDPKFPCIIKDMDEYYQYLKRLIGEYNIDNLIYTGGEPFIHYKFIKEFNEKYIHKLGIKTIEYETNGLLIGDIFDVTNRVGFGGNNVQYNISPKFIEYDQLYTDEYVGELFNHYMKDLKYSIKVPYDIKFRDLYIEFFNRNNIDKKTIVMMPITPDYDTIGFETKFRQSEYDCLAFCIENGYRYSPRIHVRLFGKLRDEFREI